MRFIRTTNSQIEFIEVNDNGQILNSIGLQLGEVYFQIKIGKVAFYLNDSEKPFDNFIWSTNIPLMIDDEVYETEDEVSEALHSIMNDSFQEQLDQLKEDLAAESARAEEAEEQLDDKIDDETSRAVSAETHLQDEITALSGTVATFDERITRNTNDISALTNTVNAEITRSTGKDGEHDAAISGLTTSLNNEISRATSAETSLNNEILAETNRAQVAESGITANLNLEIQNRIADVDAEENRALAAESALTDALNAEVSRATAKDASHDAEISGLTTSLQNEINRATVAENSLRNDLNAEITNRTSGDTQLQSNINAEETRALTAESGITANLNTEISRATGVENALRNDLTDETSARTSADAAQLQRITALEVGKADANNVYTKAESDAKYATKDYISGLTDNFYTKGQTNELLAAKADKVSAVASAIYNSTNKTIDFKNISGTVISSVDARDFIKDGMVDTVSISGTNLVITFNTDAGKEDIVVPLSNIFDPTNYYDKSAIDTIVSGLNDSIDTKLDATAYTPTDLSNYYNKQEVDASQLAQDNKISAISGDVITLSGDIITISGDAISSGEVQTMIDNSISGKTIDYLSAGRGIEISTADTISFNLPIYKGVSTSIIEGYELNKATSQYSHAEGYQTKASGQCAHAEGEMTYAIGYASHTEGQSTTANGAYSHAEGYGNEAAGQASHASGEGTKAKNRNEFASGLYNVSTTSNNDSQSTLFSVGNGVNNENRHNAFEIKKNGDIYITSGNTDIKLQDHLGGGGSGGGISSAECQSMIDNSISGKTNQSDFSAHTANTTVHITSAERTSWDAKPNVWCGDETAWSQISGSTVSGTIYLVY